MTIPKSFGTHDGVFHADEVTACAILLYYDLIDREKIIRSREKQVLDQCEFVCDVGGEYDPALKRFDHHQLSYEGELSSAGMVWAYLKDQGVIQLSEYEFLRHSLIIGIDAHDNGKVLSEMGVCTFSHIISNFTKVHYDVPSKEQDVAFKEALDFVLGHISRAMARLVYIEECKEKVKQAMEKGKRFLFFEETMPWIDSFFELGGEKHPAEFVVMPSGKQWKVRGIPPINAQRMKVRTSFPKEWAGLLEDQFSLVSGISGGIFCHKGRFIAVWKTKESALKALEHVLSLKGGDK